MCCPIQTTWRRLGWWSWDCAPHGRVLDVEERSVIDESTFRPETIPLPRDWVVTHVHGHLFGVRTSFHNEGSISAVKEHKLNYPWKRNADVKRLTSLGLDTGVQGCSNRPQQHPPEVDLCRRLETRRSIVRFLQQSSHVKSNHRDQHAQHSDRSLPTQRPDSLIP